MNRLKFRNFIIVPFCFILILTSLVFFPAKTEAASSSILFVGNSFTFYNNMPEMFAQITKAGTGNNLTVTNALLNSRTLYQHSRSISAVVRTKGNSDNLTAQERTYFGTTASSVIFRQYVYDRYSEIIWDYDNECPRHYDRIVLQIYYDEGEGDFTANIIYNAVSDIMMSMDSSTTGYVINAAWDRCTGEGGLDGFKASQNTIDGIVNTAVKKLKASADLSGRYSSLKTAYTGRAFCNYLFYAGSSIASARNPEAYDIYVYYRNDLLTGDSKHPTVLGSYLEAATLYSAIYGNAVGTCTAYKAGSYSQVTLLNGTLGANYNLSYNNGNGFKDTVLIHEAAFIADSTMGGMNLASQAAAAAWKSDSRKSNYDLMNYKAVVTFYGNGADKSTYGRQTYYFGAPGQKFKGTIEKFGYTLLGWSGNKKAKTAGYSANSAVKDAFIKKIHNKFSGKLSLYAVWTPAVIKITFNGNGADTNTFKVQKFKYGNKNQKFTGSISRTGYDFSGWAFNKSAAAGKYKKNANVSNNWIGNVNKLYGTSATLYAIWKPHVITVRYDGNGADVNTFRAQQFTYGVSGQKAEGTISREGYKFLGWALTKNSKEAKYNPNFNTSSSWIEKVYKNYNGNITLYAVWQKGASLTIDPASDIYIDEPAAENVTDEEPQYIDPDAGNEENEGTEGIEEIEEQTLDEPAETITEAEITEGPDENEEETSSEEAETTIEEEIKSEEEDN